MHLVLGLCLAFVGALELGLTGIFLGGLFGVMVAEILSLRKRLNHLELDKKSAEIKVTEDEDVVFAPIPGPIEKEKKRFNQKRKPAIPSEPAVARQPLFTALSEKLNSSTDEISQQTVKFFTSGNLVLKIGIIVLFFGVAFLLKYAAERNMLPLEFRLVGVAISGIILLGIGWRLRINRPGYGLILQGGGVGMLYLVVFAAAKLYGFLPFVFSLLVMVGLVGLSCLLAVIEESRALAIFGAVGGFLAPVLMSTGTGNHVLLFSYFALLNCGILAVAWFKSWRELNLVGFIFTFGLGTLWGSSGYRPELFYSTEPFLVLFFIFYLAISILFALRQPVNLRGYIDGPLVFGLPLVATGLQYWLVGDIEYGMAFSALFLGVVYLLLSTYLLRRSIASMGLLAETFLALGVVFGSLTIPLAFDGHWSAAIWALEGAGMVWVGVRQQRVLARHFGLILQCGAAFIFLDSVWYPYSSTPFLNRYFLGCFFLSVAPLFSSYYMDRHIKELKKWERYFITPLLVFGLSWWYIGGIREIEKQLPSREGANGFILFCSVTSIFIGISARKLGWKLLYQALKLQLPLMVLLLPLSLSYSSANHHLFKDFGIATWIVAFVVQYRVLFLYADHWSGRSQKMYHLLTFYLLLFILGNETAWYVEYWARLSPVWSACCWAIIPSAAILMTRWLGRGLSWPFGTCSNFYNGVGLMVPVAALVVWLIGSFSAAGDPAPLPFIPLINPFELVGFFVLFTLTLLTIDVYNSGLEIQKKQVWKAAAMVVAGLVFLWLNCTVARIVHFFANVPYELAALNDSVIFQAAISALWGVGALTITALATRRGSRIVWGAGAVLLTMVVLKLFLIDLSGTATVARIISFLVVGVLMLIIGYISPIPPKVEATT